MGKIVSRDSSVYPKQLPLFCVIWLVGTCACADRDRTAYIIPISVAMIELLYEFENSSS